jgi:hypothetical protein
MELDSPNTIEAPWESRVHAVPRHDRERSQLFQQVTVFVPADDFELTRRCAGIVQAIEKLQKKCIIKFTEREMHIICNDDANGEGIQVWS